MGVNWSAVFKGVGEVGDHIIETRQLEAARKAKFDDAVEMAGINFDYQKQLRAMDNTAATERETIKAGAKAASGQRLILNGMTLGGKVYAPHVNMKVEGPDDASRYTQRSQLYNSHFSELIAAVDSGDISQEDAEKLIEDSGNKSFLMDFISEQHNRFTVKNTKENFGAPSRYAAHRDFSKLNFINDRITKLRVGDITEFQKGNLEKWKAAHTPGTPTYPSTFFSTTLDAKIKPEVFALSTSKEFRSMRTQLLSGNVTERAPFYGQVRQILGENANNLTDSQLSVIVDETLIYSQQRNFIDQQSNKVRPGNYPVVNDSETSQRRIAAGREIIGSLERAADILRNSDPLVSAFGVGAQKGLSRVFTGIKEVKEMFSREGQYKSAELTKELEGALGNNEYAESIKETLATANEQAEKYYNNNKNAEGKLEGVALATYKFHMEKLYLAYAYAKYVGDARVSNADFENSMNALFGTFELDPEKQREAYSIGLMGLHYAISKEVGRSDLVNTYKRRINSASEKDFDITRGSGVHMLRDLQSQEDKANVARGDSDAYWGPRQEPRASSRAFLVPKEPPKPPVTVRKTGAAAAAANAQRRSLKPVGETQ